MSFSRTCSWGLVVLLLGAVAMTGCEGDQGPVGATGVQGPQGDPLLLKLSVVASISVFPVVKADVGANFAMSIYNAPSIPSVRLNDTLIVFSGEALYEDGRLAYYGDFAVNDTNMAVLNIAYTKEDGTAGAASSSISLPGQFANLTPTVAVPINGDFEGVWGLSEGADAYWIYEHWYMLYTDTGGIARVIETYDETVQAGNDSTLYVAWSTLFPDTTTIETISSFYGNIWIRAVTGPWLAGQANNFTGDATGLFVGSTPSRYIDVSLADVKLEMTGPAVGTSAYDSKIADERFEQRLQEMARQ